MKKELNVIKDSANCKSNLVMSSLSKIEMSSFEVDLDSLEIESNSRGNGDAKRTLNDEHTGSRTSSSYKTNYR